MMKQIKYYVKNEAGFTMGGFTTMKAAQDYKARTERELENDPWNKDMKLHIESK